MCMDMLGRTRTMTWDTGSQGRRIDMGMDACIGMRADVGMDMCMDAWRNSFFLFFFVKQQKRDGRLWIVPINIVS